MLGLILGLFCLPPLYEPSQGYWGSYSNGDGTELCANLYHKGEHVHHFKNARHVHNVLSHEGSIYVALGDEFHWDPKTKGMSRLVRSKDGGSSREVLQSHVRANYLTLTPFKNKIYLGEDSAQFNPTSRIIEYDPVNGEERVVFTLPSQYRGNIGSVQRVPGTDRHVIGSFVDQDGYNAGIRVTNNFDQFHLVHTMKGAKAWYGYGPGTKQEDALEFLFLMSKFY